MHKLITKLGVYDFDGTLMNTPLPEYGMTEWFKKTGTSYPHKGWWGRKESLNLDVFNIKPINRVENAFRNDHLSPDVSTILLTNRQHKLLPEVMLLLNKYNITFDHYLLKKGDVEKGERLINILSQFPDLKEIELWDDNFEHILNVQDWVMNKSSIEIFRYNHIISDLYYLDQTNQ
jgi:hypothetical protein